MVEKLEVAVDEVEDFRWHTAHIGQTVFSVLVFDEFRDIVIEFEFRGASDYSHDFAVHLDQRLQSVKDTSRVHFHLVFVSKIFRIDRLASVVFHQQIKSKVVHHQVSLFVLRLEHVEVQIDNYQGIDMNDLVKSMY